MSNNEKRFCPKCGKEIEKDDKFCGYCGYKLVEERGETQELIGEGRYIDEEGFVRKPRNGVGILSWIIGAFLARGLWNLPYEYSFISIILLPVIAYLLYFGIKAFSSHDIETWRHRKNIKTWIYVGCLFAGIVGIIIYYYLKSKERAYLHTQKLGGD